MLFPEKRKLLSQVLAIVGVSVTNAFLLAPCAWADMIDHSKSSNFSEFEVTGLIAIIIVVLASAAAFAVGIILGLKNKDTLEEANEEALMRCAVGTSTGANGTFAPGMSNPYPQPAQPPQSAPYFPPSVTQHVPYGSVAQSAPHMSSASQSDPYASPSASQPAPYVAPSNDQSMSYPPPASQPGQSALPQMPEEGGRI